MSSGRLMSYLAAFSASDFVAVALDQKALILRSWFSVWSVGTAFLLLVWSLLSLIPSGTFILSSPSGLSLLSLIPSGTFILSSPSGFGAFCVRSVLDGRLHRLVSSFFSLWDALV